MADRGAGERQPDPPPPRVRHRILVRGLVQGVGFRPCVYALARELGLAGAVANTADGVTIEVEGAPDAVAEFARRLGPGAPTLARIHAIETVQVPCRGGTEFRIEESHAGSGRTLISADVATCPDCLVELADPDDRRYRHPFISCTNCGPRFTVVVDLPYDRPATTMAELPLCELCAGEYADPADRRFHAQTIACPRCGPTATLHSAGGEMASGDAALVEAQRLLAGGAIVAVKGLGGYHLACDATDDVAVSTLRKRKDRGDKPFAVMVPDVATAELIASVGAAERALLLDARRPVVVLAKRPQPLLVLSDAVAPTHPDLGIMLPYTPVHQLLFAPPADGAGPCALVMTSGNLAGEPIVTEDAEARTRLSAIADAWLSHDRPIAVPCDDSVVRVAAGAELPIRRSRGYAPLPIGLPLSVTPGLAVGGDLKNTFSVGADRYAWLSAHVGDMDDLATLRAFDAAVAHLGAITGTEPELIVTDAHPGYRSAAWARHHAAGRPVHTVQHHHAHIASALAENGHDGHNRVIGMAFDGTGYGADGAVWGGEVLVADYAGYERVAHLRYVPLPGGDAAVHNPYRMALSHLRAAGLPWDPRLPCVAECPPVERSVLARQLDTGLQCTPTSSMGRLFDAMSSLAGVCHRAAYEAEAAMRFEGLARSIRVDETPYAFDVIDDGTGPLQADPAAVITAAASDVLSGADPALVGARFHLAVARLIVELAVRLRERTGLHTVALSGGVFLNALLTELTVGRLEDAGLNVLRHRRVPPSDAGLALGQLAVGAHRRSDQ